MALRPVLVKAGLALLLALPAPIAQAQNSGAYLAARSAMIANDYQEAARYFGQALVRDPSNIPLLESAATAYLGLGDLDRAVPVARRLAASAENSQLAGLIVLGDDARNEDWDAILTGLENGVTVGPLFDGLARSWAMVGAGRMSDALASLDDLATNSGVEAFAMYHKALALASAGDFESASEVFSGETGPTIRVTRRGVIASAQVLSQLDRQEEAIDLITDSFGTNLDPFLIRMKEQLEAGDVLEFDAVKTATDGMAEVYFSIANALRGEAQGAYTLLYSRMAMALREDHNDALLLTAELLESLERYDLATEVYDTVPRDHPSFHAAELGRADALRRSGREDAAIEVLRQLTESHGDVPQVHITLGDTLRGLERYEESIEPYDNALSLIESPDAQHWIIYFARAISHERLDEWAKAEADFRKALELRPEQPQVMNYLGYSFLEMQINYDEALDLIERAAALRPDSGYIIDSLGWGLYRVGRYAEAVPHMERAVELMPIDPIVNDHLGDVYWAVGRQREAEFQWTRALSYITDKTDPNDVDADRIRRKLEVGLDEVLAEEGAPPLEVANDDG